MSNMENNMMEPPKQSDASMKPERELGDFKVNPDGSIEANELAEGKEELVYESNSTESLEIAEKEIAMLLAKEDRTPQEEMRLQRFQESKKRLAGII